MKYDAVILTRLAQGSFDTEMLLASAVHFDQYEYIYTNFVEAIGSSCVRARA